jgi:tetratricopeptide (TPR) repeat protein
MRSYNDGINTSTYAIQKALKIDPNLANSYALLARIQTQQKNFVDSEKNILKALSIDGNSSNVINYAAINAMLAGDLKASLKYRKQLLIINPKYYLNYYNIGKLNFLLLNNNLAYQYFSRYLNYSPKSAVTHHLICSVLLAQGKNKLALEHANKEKNEFWKNYALSMAEFANGNTLIADELLEDFIEQNKNTDPTNIARIYAFRGEYEKSFEWLNIALEQPDSTLISWLNFPEFKNMHADSRWEDVINKMKLPKNHWLVKQLN